MDFKSPSGSTAPCTMSKVVMTWAVWSVERIVTATRGDPLAQLRTQRLTLWNTRVASVTEPIDATVLESCGVGVSAAVAL
jgi:hypothetical protein